MAKSTTKSKSAARQDDDEDEAPRGSTGLPQGYNPPQSMRSPAGGHPPMNRTQMEAVIKGGGSVYHHGKYISNLDDLPPGYLVAATSAEKREVVKNLKADLKAKETELEKAEADLAEAEEREAEEAEAQAKLDRARSGKGRGKGSASDESSPAPENAPTV